METLTSNTTKKTTQNINLIDGRFTVSEAADIINDVLKVKINFHKLHRLSITEGNSSDPCEYDNSRIHELINEQQIAKDFFNEIRFSGKKVKISSTIHIEIEE